LYDVEYFFHPNPLNRYSLGTKNKNLKYNADGSLTLYAGSKSPGKDKESNWLPAPDGAFSLYIRAYWSDKPILDGQWKPPVVNRVQLLRRVPMVQASPIMALQRSAYKSDRVPLRGT
jgi:hypothetical protein